MEDINGLHLKRDSYFYQSLEMDSNVSRSAERDNESIECSQHSQQEQEVNHSSSQEVSHLSSHLHRYRSRTLFARQLSNSEICRRRRESIAAIVGHNLSGSGSGLNVVSGLESIMNYMNNSLTEF
jgi:hypothetical protein